MKKIAAMFLGLSLMLGTTSMFAADDTTKKPTKTKTSKSKSKSKTKTKKTDTTSTEKKS